MSHKPKFDRLSGGLVVNRKVVKTKILIKRDPTGINTTTSNSVVPHGIYTLSGVKLNGNEKDLSKGIYIINGKKL